MNTSTAFVLGVAVGALVYGAAHQVGHAIGLSIAVKALG